MTLEESNLSALRAAMSNITDTAKAVKVVEGIYIESGIDMPVRAKKLQGMAAVAAKMKVGDSVKLRIPEGGSASYTAASLQYHLKKMGRKTAHRAIDGGKAVRVWRI
jgi:hypothetical protein